MKYVVLFGHGIRCYFRAWNIRRSFWGMKYVVLLGHKIGRSFAAWNASRFFWGMKYVVLFGNEMRRSFRAWNTSFFSGMKQSVLLGPGMHLLFWGCKHSSLSEFRRWSMRYTPVRIRTSVRTPTVFQSLDTNQHSSTKNKSETERWNRGCTSGGVYVPCIYTHARWESP